MSRFFSDFNNEIDWVEVNSLSSPDQSLMRFKLNNWHEPGISRFILSHPNRQLGDVLFKFMNNQNLLYVAKENGVDIATMLINPCPTFSYTKKLTEHFQNLSSNENEIEVENVLSLERTQSALSVSKDDYFTNIGFLVVCPEYQGNKVARKCLSSLIENTSTFSPYDQIISTTIRKENHRSIRAFEACGFEKIQNNSIDEQNFYDYFFVNE